MLRLKLNHVSKRDHWFANRYLIYSLELRNFVCVYAIRHRVVSSSVLTISWSNHGFVITVWTHFLRNIMVNVSRVSFGGVVNMLLVLPIAFYFHYNIWGCMCSTGTFQYRWLKGYIYSSCYYHHQIGSVHLSHCSHIFPWLCVCDVCDIIFCCLLHIHSGKTANLFSFFMCSLWWEQIVRYVLAWISYSFICTLHHLIVQTYLKTLNL